MHDGREPIRFLQTTNNYLVACFNRSFVVFDLSQSEDESGEKHQEIVSQMELPHRSIGWYFLVFV